MNQCARTVDWQASGHTARCAYAEGHIGPHSDGLHTFDQFGLRVPGGREMEQAAPRSER